MNSALCGGLWWWNGHFLAMFIFDKEFLMSQWWATWRQRIPCRDTTISSKKRPALSFFCMLILVSIALVACTSNVSNTTGNTHLASATVTPTPVSLTQVSWCGQPQMTFRDQASSSVKSASGQTGLGPADNIPKTLTDWNVVKANLGFTWYLPPTLPAGTCLLSVSSSLRDPVFGSNFTIDYVLPNHDALSFSQAPLRTQSRTAFQCNVSQQNTSATPVAGTAVAIVTPTPTQVPTQLCSGTVGQTSIVFADRGTTSTLQKFFQSLQANVDWQPAK
jgi:hypothetical protein